MSSILVEYTSKYKEILHKLILAYLKGRPEYAILDIGCRWGDDLRRVSNIDIDKKLFGIDMELGPLKIASRKLDNISMVYLLQARAEQLPFQDGSFNLVYSSEVIEHIEDVEYFLKEVRRILKINGVFIITTPSKYNYTTLLGRFIPNISKKHLRRWAYYINPVMGENPHIREFTHSELKKIFERNKYLVEKIESGALRVPMWPLFDKFNFLLSTWKCLDRFIDKLPFGAYIKFNFVMVARRVL